MGGVRGEGPGGFGIGGEERGHDCDANHDAAGEPAAEPVQVAHFAIQIECGRAGPYHGGGDGLSV